MNERMRLIREDLNLTIAEFARKLYVQWSTIKNIEQGVNNVSNQMVRLTSLTFNINEAWLRTGEGEMKLADNNSETHEFLKLCENWSDEELKVLLNYMKGYNKIHHKK